MKKLINNLNRLLVLVKHVVNKTDYSNRFYINMKNISYVWCRLSKIQAKQVPPKLKTTIIKVVKLLKRKTFTYFKS